MSEQIIWMWNKRPVPLENLDEKQLYSIKRSVEASENKVWFGYKSDDILKEINTSLQYQQQVYKLIKNMRIKRAVQNADLVLNGMVKCMSRINQKQLN